MLLQSLIGNRALIDRLKRLLTEDRLPASLLFVGPQGVGKFDAALAIAKALNCTIAQSDACNQCPTCTRIDKNEHPDVKLVEPQGASHQIKADAVRQIIHDAPFRPFEGRRRVTIFTEADRMNPTASNTLLKTLEEPPPWVQLILVTARETTILPTLLSRCNKFRFRPLQTKELAQLLVRQHDIPKEGAILLAALSGGSLSKALRLDLDTLTTLRQKAMQLALVTIKGSSRENMVRLAEQTAKETNLELLLQVLLGLIRDLAAASSGGATLHQEFDKELQALTRSDVSSAWITAYQKAEKSFDDIRTRHLNKRITLERLLLDLSDLSMVRSNH